MSMKRGRVFVDQILWKWNGFLEHGNQRLGVKSTRFLGDSFRDGKNTGREKGHAALTHCGIGRESDREGEVGKGMRRLNKIN